MLVLRAGNVDGLVGEGKPADGFFHRKSTAPKPANRVAVLENARQSDSRVPFVAMMRGSTVSRMIVPLHPRRQRSGTITRDFAGCDELYAASEGAEMVAIGAAC